MASRVGEPPQRGWCPALGEARQVFLTGPTAASKFPTRNASPGPRRVFSFAAGALENYPGAVAEWLRSGLQSRVHRFDSGPRLQFLPA